LSFTYRVHSASTNHLNLLADYYNKIRVLNFEVEKMFKKVLVCLDGSGLAEEILPFVLGQCQLENEVILLKVIKSHITIPPPESMHVLTLGRDSKPGQIHTTDVGKSTTLEPKAGLELREIEREQGEAKAYLNSVAERFRSKDLKIKTLTLQGDVRDSILNYSRNSKVSLIALTTHGSGGLKHGVLGSIAQFILKEAEIPVLIIKPKG
jgi:nucleotide-binding universal stress UspA family protein